VEVLQSGYGLFTTNIQDRNSCSQVTTLEFGKVKDITKPQELERVQASIGGRTLTSIEIMRDDAEWRFVLSRTDLTTEKYARELRTSTPNPPIQFKAEATVYFVTGECIPDREAQPQ
jgi:hypothetical protein